MKRTLKPTDSHFALPGDRIWMSDYFHPESTGWHLVLRARPETYKFLTTPFRWWHWLTRWFL